MLKVSRFQGTCPNSLFLIYHSSFFDTQNFLVSFNFDFSSIHFDLEKTEPNYYGQDQSFLLKFEGLDYLKISVVI